MDTKQDEEEEEEDNDDDDDDEEDDDDDEGSFSLSCTYTCKMKRTVLLNNKRQLFVICPTSRCNWASDLQRPVIGPRWNICIGNL